MFCRISTVPWCLKFIPISCMGPKHAPKDIFDFSTNLYALENVHVVQIWIVHINALKTQLMHKMSKRTPKMHIALLLFYVDMRKFWKQ